MALKQAIYRDANPSLSPYHGKLNVKRYVCAPTLDDLDAEFTASVEEESRRKAWVLHQELNKKPGTFSEFFVVGFRPLRILRSTSSGPKRSYFGSCRRYVVDSGASIHLIGNTLIRAKEKKSLRPTSHTHEIQTANGKIEVSEECLIHTQELGIWVWAKLAGSDSPAVLSLGRPCA